MLGEAVRRGLDFLGVTDHNQVGHHADYAAARGEHLPIVLPGVEVTTYGGHWNAWGTDRWWEFREPNAPAVSRTMQQAMLLMNNEQIQKQIDASPGSGTMLARLVESEADYAKAVTRLYENILARKPNVEEIDLAKKHIAKVGERKAAYEDLLWSLVNGAEFLSRR